jgi:hypothetical protein
MDLRPIGLGVAAALMSVLFMIYSYPISISMVILISMALGDLLGSDIWHTLPIISYAPFAITWSIYNVVTFLLLVATDPHVQ